MRECRSVSGQETTTAAHARSFWQPLKNSISDRLFKNDEMQGARILRNEAYNQYAAMTKDQAQRSRSRFSTACWGLVGRIGSGRP